MTEATNPGDLEPCPQCSSDGATQTFLGMLGDSPTFRCSACGWTYFEHEAQLARGVIANPPRDHQNHNNKNS